MKQYINLLKSEPILKRLSTIQLIAYFGAWFSNVAIYTLLLDMGVSATVISFVAMLHFMAGVFQAPISGVIIDSIKPKTIMLTLIVFEILSTLMLVFITTDDDLVLLYFLIFIKMASASFYFTTEMSLLPKILDGKKLQLANELHSMIWSFSYTLGMASSGFFVYMFGVKNAFLLDAMMFIVSFFLLYFLELNVNISKQKENFLKMMGESLSYLKTNKKTLHLMLVHAFVGITAFDALVALMVDTYYSSIIATSLALGFIHASRATGLVVGPMFLSSWITNKRVVYLFVFQGLAVLLWSVFMYDFYFSLMASFVVGFFTTTLWSYTYTLLQKNTDENYYGRVVAYNDMFFLGTAGLTSFGIGFLKSLDFSLEFIAVVMGFGFFIGAFYFRWILKRYKI